MTIASWGKGKPDYYGGTIPAGQERVPDQDVFHLTATAIPIPANSTITLDPLYAVPSGKRVVIGYIKPTMDTDCMLYGCMLVNGISYCPAYVYQIGLASLSPIAGFDFTAGTTLGWEGINYLDEAIVVTFELQGYIYDV